MTDQLTFALPSPPASVAFDGQTYCHDQDHNRLKSQLHRVALCMSDGRWRTLSEIQQVAKGSEAAISARLRDLRKQQYGGLKVESKRFDGGLWKYRLVLDESPDAARQRNRDRIQAISGAR